VKIPVIVAASSRPPLPAAGAAALLDFDTKFLFPAIVFANYHQCP
jgi:hypothetical protein